MIILTTENVKVIVKKAKKVNVKEVAKAEIMTIIENALTSAGVDFKSGENYGMTKGTIIVSHSNSDVQIKPISPKSGLERYIEQVEE